MHLSIAFNPSFDVVSVGITLFLITYAAVFICALISIIASPQGFGMKLVWVVLAFSMPFIGSMLWFFIGRGEARRRIH